jgi:hypothetical protein
VKWYGAAVGGEYFRVLPGRLLLPGGAESAAKEILFCAYRLVRQWKQRNTIKIGVKPLFFGVLTAEIGVL